MGVCGPLGKRPRVPSFDVGNNWTRALRGRVIRQYWDLMTLGRSPERTRRSSAPVRNGIACTQESRTDGRSADKPGLTTHFTVKWAFHSVMARLAIGDTTIRFCSRLKSVSSESMLLIYRRTIEVRKNSLMS